MENTFINKVAESGIITLDLEEFLPKEDIVLFDLKEYLFMGLILKEKDFREALKNMDATVYDGKIVAVTCTADAVIPMWAYMLVAGYVQPYAKAIIFGDKTLAEESILVKNIEGINVERYTGQRMVIKGCGEKHIPEAAYIKITELLRPVAKSIMFGEPCSTVPIYKKPKES